MTIQEVLDQWSEEGRSFKNIEEIYALADEIISEGGPFTCGTGTPCYGCCTQYFKINRIEFNAALNEAIRSGYLGEHNLAKVMMEAHRRKEWTRSDRTKADVPCLFQRRDGQCSVYKSRPLVCRSYNLKDYCGTTCHMDRGRAPRNFLWTDDRIMALSVVLIRADPTLKTIEQHLVEVT
jgi:Fe-S-cluster containining protein